MPGVVFNILNVTTPKNPTTTNHNNQLTTKQDNHAPKSPSTTMSTPSMSPAATSCNPHHKVPCTAKIWQLPNWQPHTKKTVSRKQWPACNKQQQQPRSNENHSMAVGQPPAPTNDNKSSTHKWQQHVHAWPQCHEWLNVWVGACHSQQHSTHVMQTDEGQKQQQ